ncbi:MAG: hypothetical protein M1828_002976 [Chrysothrix sp. TS-e1954]|nr:MAG: hypothetical protein M1828_002976 [Chrysothrix sp. TS-e1954]
MRRSFGKGLTSHGKVTQQCREKFSRQSRKRNWDEAVDAFVADASPVDDSPVDASQSEDDASPLEDDASPSEDDADASTSTLAGSEVEDSADGGVEVAQSIEANAGTQRRGQTKGSGLNKGRPGNTQRRLALQTKAKTIHRKFPTPSSSSSGSPTHTPTPTPSPSPSPTPKSNSKHRRVLTSSSSVSPPPKRAKRNIRRPSPAQSSASSSPAQGSASPSPAQGSDSPSPAQGSNSPSPSQSSASLSAPSPPPRPIKRTIRRSVQHSNRPPPRLGTPTISLRSHLAITRTLHRQLDREEQVHALDLRAVKHAGRQRRLEQRTALDEIARGLLTITQAAGRVQTGLDDDANGEHSFFEAGGDPVAEELAAMRDQAGRMDYTHLTDLDEAIDRADEIAEANTREDNEDEAEDDDDDDMEDGDYSENDEDDEQEDEVEGLYVSDSMEES